MSSPRSTWQGSLNLPSPSFHSRRVSRRNLIPSSSFSGASVGPKSKFARAARSSASGFCDYPVTLISGPSDPRSYPTSTTRNIHCRPSLNSCRCRLGCQPSPYTPRKSLGSDISKSMTKSIPRSGGGRGRFKFYEIVHGAVAAIASISKTHPCAGASSPAKAPLHDRPCVDRPQATALPHARRSVAHDGTARRAGALVDSVDDPLRLDRHHWFYATILVSTAQIVATLSPTLRRQIFRSAVPNAFSRSLDRTSLWSVR